VQPNLTDGFPRLSSSPTRSAIGDIDVVVTDGFTGNVALKTAEGIAR
jgi:hypothetical protein